ncbi:hypothetical protein ACR6C2_40360 [Streptomyces sp. INA 01156]
MTDQPLPPAVREVIAGLVGAVRTGTTPASTGLGDQRNRGWR